jgi:HAD superfamily hydrolase (TIGR01509 family)
VCGVSSSISVECWSTPQIHTSRRREQRLGLEPGQIGQRLGDVFVAGCYGRVTEAQVREAMSARLEIDAETADAFQADLWVEYLGTANTELLAYFRGLRGRCPTAILSNSFVGAREREHEHLGLEGLCDTVAYSHEVGFYKPEHEIYELTCERLGLPPEQLAFLDDHPDYIRGAEEVGMHAITFTDNTTAIPAVEAWLNG